MTDRWHFLAVAALAVLSCTTAACLADSQVPALPDAIKQSAEIGSDQSSQIDQAVGALAQDLSTTTDPAQQSADRRWLVDQSESAGGNATPQYVSAYAQSVNSHLLKLVDDPNCAVRVAIESGLAAASLANTSHGVELVPLATALLKHKSPTVAYVGMKLVHSLMPAILNEAQLSPDDNALLAQILQAVTANPNPPLGGRIVAEAYQSMTDAVFSANPPQASQIMQVLVPLTEKLEKQRLAMYQNGAPDNPSADSSGLVVLLSRNVWQQLQPNQEADVLTMVAQLIDAAAKSAANDKIQDEVVEQLKDQLKTDGSALRLFCDPNGGPVSNPTLFAAAQELGQVGKGTPPTAVADAASSAVDAINSYKSTLSQLPTSN